jgi:hypothetical protein
VINKAGDLTFPIWIRASWTRVPKHPTFRPLHVDTVIYVRQYRIHPVFIPPADNEYIKKEDFEWRRSEWGGLLG